ncbi:MAG: RNA polymerase sigma factor [Myxococcales bacterium]|nr:RNA polymerase sigma factor [Myxococcales bacterium]
MEAGDPRTDEQLVEAVNAGDERAFAALYLRHRRWAADLAWRFVRDRDVALDVMQDAFLHLLGRFPGFRLTARLRTFLYPVVKHLALDRLRKSRRHLAGGERLDELPARGAGDGAPPAGIAAAVEDLPEGQREVLLMRFVDDLPLADIAEALGVPVGTVKSRLHNGLAALRADPRFSDLLADRRP